MLAGGKLARDGSLGTDFFSDVRSSSHLSKVTVIS